MKVILPCCLLWMPGVWAPSPLQQNNQQTDVFHSTRFFEWLAQNGARVDKLRLSSERSLWEGRNTIAAAPVTKGEVVVSVPDNLLMTASLAMARSETARRVHNSGLIPEGTRQHCVIAVYLAEQRTLGPFSVFAPYIEALPHSYSHLPMFFDERDMGLFQAASFRLTVYAQREQLESEFRAVVRAAGALGVPFSRRTFMWARAVVWTRAFNVNPVDQCNAATIALVPMADLINHRAEPNTKWEYNKGLQRFTMTATANIGMGESVHDSYGPKTNSNYFRNFGFTLDNAADEVALVFAPAELTETSMALPGRPGDPPRTPCLSPRERFLFDLNHGHVYVPGKAFVLQFNQGLEAILDYLRGFAPAGVEPQSALALLHAFQLLHGKVTRQIATFPTTKDQDEALLRDASRQPPLSVRHYRAVVIRRGEKRALQYMADVSANAMLSSTLYSFWSRWSLCVRPRFA